MTGFDNAPVHNKSDSPTTTGNRLARIMRKAYGFLTSVKLAMALLIAILACCLIGATVIRGVEAGTLIFSTLWFNGLLVLLVVNVGFCFFSRIWGRKLTLISLGMIMFHLSFVAILGGIVFNSLFYFRGLIRLTEGETLPSGQPQSYDAADHGRFFDYSQLKGETTLIRMHTGYRVDGADKRAAYDIAVGEGDAKQRGIIYLTNNLDHNGFRYIPDREGYSVLLVIYDKQGREIHGAYVPLQSLKQKDGKYLYVTGTAAGPGKFPFPLEAQKPLIEVQVAYVPDPNTERAGNAFFRAWPTREAQAGQERELLAEGTAAVGESFKAGDYYLSVKEVRYWVGMGVRHEPGQPIVLASLWVGLAGMVVTFVGRIRKRRTEGQDS